MLFSCIKEREDAKFWIRKGQNDLAKALQRERNTNVAKNVVMMIGDGMGTSTITAARIRKGQLKGKTGEETVLHMDRFPIVGMVKVIIHECKFANKMNESY